MAKQKKPKILSADDIAQLFSPEEIDLNLAVANGAYQIQLHHPTDADMVQYLKYREGTVTSGAEQCCLMLWVCSDFTELRQCYTLINQCNAEEIYEIMTRTAKLVGFTNPFTIEEVEETQGGTAGNAG